MPNYIPLYMMDNINGIGTPWPPWSLQFENCGSKKTLLVKLRQHGNVSKAWIKHNTASWFPNRFCQPVTQCCGLRHLIFKLGCSMYAFFLLILFCFIWIIMWETQHTIVQYSLPYGCGFLFTYTQFGQCSFMKGTIDLSRQKITKGQSALSCDCWNIPSIVELSMPNLNRWEQHH